MDQDHRSCHMCWVYFFYFIKLASSLLCSQSFSYTEWTMGPEIYATKSDEEPLSHVSGSKYSLFSGYRSHVPTGSRICSWLCFSDWEDGLTGCSHSLRFTPMGSLPGGRGLVCVQVEEGSFLSWLSSIVQWKNAGLSLGFSLPQGQSCATQ